MDACSRCGRPFPCPNHPPYGDAALAEWLAARAAQRPDTHAPRYTVRDLRLTQHSGLRKIREPYLIIDSETGLPVDEFASKKAATETAHDLNREHEKGASHV